MDPRLAGVLAVPASVGEREGSTQHTVVPSESKMARTVSRVLAWRLRATNPKHVLSQE